MKVNEAPWDRAIRIVLGTSLIVAGFGGFVGGTAGTIVGLVGFLPLVTGLLGFCPLYRMLGFATCRTER